MSQTKGHTRLRWWLHSQRPKHESRMAYAEALVEKGEAFKRISQRERDSELLVEGYRQIQLAIREVVECGCPRRLWREAVQEHVVAPSSEGGSV